MGRFEMDDGWQAEVDATVQVFFEDRLGPDIAKDAKRYCPERTGALQDSIEHHLEGDDLIVSATGGDGGRIYAAYLSGTRPPRLSSVHGYHWPRSRSPKPFLETCTISRAQRMSWEIPVNSI